MADEKKTASLVGAPTAKGSVKPLAVQVVDAIVDGAASIAKGIIIDTAERVTKSVENTKLGKAASSLVTNAEKAKPKRGVKKAAVKRPPRKTQAAATKKAVTKRAPVRKSGRKPGKKTPPKKDR
jgi:hypothetical protein